MSKQNVTSFFHKAERDETIRAQLKALSEHPATDDAAAIRALVGIAASAGFEFTRDDFEQVRASKTAKVSSEIKWTAANGRTAIAGGNVPGPWTYSSLCLCQGSIHS